MKREKNLCTEDQGIGANGGETTRDASLGAVLGRGVRAGFRTLGEGRSLAPCSTPVWRSLCTAKPEELRADKS